jgi:acrylyl-CoA reductase (NADPH)
MTFKALLAAKTGEKISTSVVEMTEHDLMPGDVTIAVDYSTVNYKDALAITGRVDVIRQFPLIPGIDLAGTVEASSYPGIAVGDRVVANSWGLSQTHHGGYAQKARLKGEWLVKIPAPFSTKDAMAIGTAGYTAMLSVLALEHGGVTPQRGDILVTGANGGVGSIAIAILSGLGYRVVASTGRLEEADYLRSLGAAEIIDRRTLSEPGPPIAGERWAGAVDSVGSHTLVNVLAQTQYRGVVTACGLAQGLDLPGSVLPFILRNITLAGIDSVNAPQEVRVEAWSRLARDLDLNKLARTTRVVSLAEVPDVVRRMFEGESPGPHSRRRQRLAPLRSYHSTTPNRGVTSSIPRRSQRPPDPAGLSTGGLSLKRNSLEGDHEPSPPDCRQPASVSPQRRHRRPVGRRGCPARRSRSPRPISDHVTSQSA